jgi:hypothetical protein
MKEKDAWNCGEAAWLHIPARAIVVPETPAQANRKLE